MSTEEKFDIFKFEKIIIILNKVLAIFIPNVLLLISAYSVEKNIHILYTIGAMIIALFVSFVYDLTSNTRLIKNWEVAKLVQFIFLYIFLVFISYNCSFLENEYLLFVPMSIVVLTVSPFRKTNLSIVFFSFFVITGVLL